MSRKVPWLLPVLVPALALAQDFQRTVASRSDTGTLCVTWSDRRFLYHADQAGSARTPGDAEFEAIDRAFATWQAVSDGCSDFHFDAGARLDRPSVGQGSEGANVITFREVDCATTVSRADPCFADDSCGNTYACWSHASGTIALTTVTYSTSTGVAVDADIELHAGQFLFTTVDSPPCAEGREAVTCVAIDLQNTLTHEIGHVLGFDHVPSPGSTMAATAAIGETSKRIIDPGTGTGFCDTYPRGQPPTPCDLLAASQRRIEATPLGCGCQGAPSAQGALALALGLAALRRPRRASSRLRRVAGDCGRVSRRHDRAGRH